MALAVPLATAVLTHCVAGGDRAQVCVANAKRRANDAMALRTEDHILRPRVVYNDVMRAGTGVVDRSSAFATGHIAHDHGYSTASSSEIK